jgi:hypothetical protein
MARLVFKPGAVPTFANVVARQDVQRTLVLINRQARDNAPGGPYSTGNLKRSIRWRITINIRGRVAGESGSELDHAIFAERGTQPHEILPRGAYNLRFYWRRVGRVVSLPRVSHPGMDAQNFMTRALLSVAPRRGYRVVIYS